LVLPDLTVELVTDRGVFSADRVDPGTRYLLSDGPPVPDHATDVVDVGCGYGPIAIALAIRRPAACVWAIDVNRRALALCAENAAAIGLSNVRARAPEDVPPEVRFDALWSNPPIRIGKAALHELLDSWLRRLTPGGHAYLVVQKHLGADSLQRWLVDSGWPTSRLGSRAGYRLLDAVAPDPRGGGT
jgi:16S rRNA (guanine1207-N2)-methyltransferase